MTHRFIQIKKRTYIPSALIAWLAGIYLFLRSVFKLLEGSKTFPGAEAKKMLDVITTAMTVAILLLLNAFDWTITKGRR